jgi:hypothetical protein
MRRGMALAILIGTTLPALAGGGFDIVIPGRPGVPIIINGIDASYAAVEGEWGLGRNDQSWSAQSTPQPAQPEVPFYPPPVILAPQGGEDFARPPQDFDHRKIRKLPH